MTALLVSVGAVVAQCKRLAACAALAALLVGAVAHADERKSATPAATGSIICIDPAAAVAGPVDQSAPTEPIGQADAAAAGVRAPALNESFPWGALILGAVALNAAVSVAWTIMRHSRRP